LALLATFVVACAPGESPEPDKVPPKNRVSYRLKALCKQYAIKVQSAPSHPLVATLSQFVATELQHVCDILLQPLQPSLNQLNHYCTQAALFSVTPPLRLGNQ
jgi:hypothetical protein